VAEEKKKKKFRKRVVETFKKAEATSFPEEIKMGRKGGSRLPRDV